MPTRPYSHTQLRSGRAFSTEVGAPRLRSRKKAARRFREWEKSLPSSIQDEFEDVTRPLGNWRSQILNYFDHRSANSLVENFAKVIGLIDDRTDGCDFSTMRGKVVFRANHKTKTEGRGRGPMESEGIGLGNAQLPPGGRRQLGQEPRTIDYGAPFEELLDWMEA